MLNWRRDPDHERKLADIEMKIIDEDLRIADIEMRIIEEDQRAAASERRTRQIESDIVRLRQQNAKGRELLASMHALCYPDASSSTPAPPIATGSEP